MLTMKPMVDQPPTKALMRMTLRSFQRRNKIQNVFVAMICKLCRSGQSVPPPAKCDGCFIPRT